MLVDQLLDLRFDIASSGDRGCEGGAAAAVAREAKRVAHSIKGLAATFGAQPLVAIAQEIEDEPVTFLEVGSQERMQRFSNVAERTVRELAARLSLKQLPMSPP